MILKKTIPFLIPIFALVFLFSGYMLARELIDQKNDADNFHALAELVAVKPETIDPIGDIEQPESNSTGATTQTPPIQLLRDLNPLFKKNPDCIGWIYVEGTRVDYPVMHTPADPERYLYRNFYQEDSPAGVPFLEGICILECDNLILYGHNMKNGTMFADVTNYRMQDYATAHPIIEFQTAQELKQYTVFAVARLKSNDDWYSFHHATNEAEYNDLVSDIKARSLCDLGVTPQYGQQLLTLSTCYGFDQNDRIVVIGCANE